VEVQCRTIRSCVDSASWKTITAWEECEGHIASTSFESALDQEKDAASSPHFS